MGCGYIVFRLYLSLTIRIERFNRRAAFSDAGGYRKMTKRQQLVNASGRSRAGKNGKVLHHSCGASFKVYHFAWSACTCRGCGEVVIREDFKHLAYRECEVSESKPSYT